MRLRSPLKELFAYDEFKSVIQYASRYFYSWWCIEDAYRFLVKKHCFPDIFIICDATCAEHKDFQIRSFHKILFQIITFTQIPCILNLTFLIFSYVSLIFYTYKNQYNNCSTIPLYHPNCTNAHIIHFFYSTALYLHNIFTHHQYV